MEGMGHRIKQECRLLTTQPSRKPPGMEGKCMRCGKPEHLQGQNVQPRMQSAKNATRLDTSTRYASLKRGLEEPT